MESQTFGANIEWGASPAHREYVLTFSYKFRTRYWQRRDRYERELANRQIRAWKKRHRGEVDRRF